MIYTLNRRLGPSSETAKAGIYIFWQRGKMHIRSSRVFSVVVFLNSHYIGLLGSHNKIPQAVAYTTEMYCLIVVGAGSPRSRCWQHWFLLWSPQFADGRLLALPSRGLSSLSLIPE